jgi:branched-chain amino acid transport system substrate-binding protein
LGAGTSITIYELGGGYISRIRCCEKLVGGAAAEYLAGTVKSKKIGILYNNDDYGNGARQVIVDYLKEHYPDCEVAVEVGHNTGDKDMTGGLLAIKDAGCDAMVAWTHSPEGAIIQRQFSELGMKDSVYFLGGPVWGMPGFHELVEDSIVDGMTCVTDFAKNNDEPETQEFLKAYKEKYGVDADSFAAYYYDAANIAMEAMALCGENFTREAFIAAVPKVQFNGVSGKIYCGKEGMDFIHRVVIGTISAKNNVKDIVNVQFVEFYD